MNPFERIFRALNRARVKYMVVGGVAVNLYGFVRFTGDIDVLVALDVKNLEKFSQVMKSLDYTQRLPVNVHELGDRKKVRQWMKEKGLKAYTFMSPFKPPLDLDILVGESFIFEKFFKKKKMMRSWGIRLPVVAFDDLVRMKRRAGRGKDLLDLESLLELKTL